MKHYFLRNGPAFIPADEGALNLHDKLPGGTYLIKQMPMNGPLYFEQVENFQMPKKVYGNVAKRADRIITSFNERPLGTGVLLTGEKGSGKTLLAKVLSERLRVDANVPTIIINQPWLGDQFNQLIQTLQQPAVVLFDEFEKVYDHQKQQLVLTLLDGVFPSKKLFILTVNDEYRVNEHMRNRPGRLYYHVSYAGLETDFIRDYCADTLKDPTQTESVLKVATMFNAFNFDMLQALVEEMNRYEEPAYQALEMLNARPDSDRGGVYDVVVSIKGQKIKAQTPEVWNGNPQFVGEIDFGIQFEDSEYDEPTQTEGGTDPDDEFDPSWLMKNKSKKDKFDLDLILRRESLVEIKVQDGALIYRQQHEGYGEITVTFKRRKVQQFRYDARTL